MESQVYNHARYYEIAFGFVDAKKQVDLFEAFIKEYSKVKVSAVLDIACGTALQLRELAKRGYRAIGIDMNSEMVGYLKDVSHKEGFEIEAIKVDMKDFHLKNKVDFAYIMMGSIVYTRDSESFLSHMNSVAETLNSGGLYLIENMIMNMDGSDFWKPQSWTMKEGNIEVTTTYELLPRDIAKQEVTQVITLDVDDGGEKIKISDKDDLKMILPEEIKTLIEKNGKFELLGFFERDSLKPLEKDSSNNVVALRRI